MWGREDIHDYCAFIDSDDQEIVFYPTHNYFFLESVLQFSQFYLAQLRSPSQKVVYFIGMQAAVDVVDERGQDKTLCVTDVVPSNPGEILWVQLLFDLRCTHSNSSVLLNMIGMKYSISSNQIYYSKKASWLA